MYKLISLFLLLAISIQNQAIEIVVKERYIKFHGDRKNALVVEVVGVEDDDLVDAWAKRMKKLDGDVDKKRNDVIALETLLPEVFELPTAIYATADEKDGFVLFAVSMSIGKDELSSVQYPSAYKALETYLIDFVKEVLRAKADEEIEKAMEVLEDEKEAMEKLKKENASLKEKIVGWKEDIKQAESEVIVNESEQQKKALDIETKKKLLQEAELKKRQI